MKAILVIEMPSKCCNCMFEDGSYCELKEVALDDVFSTEIPNDCPLKPIPEKKDGDFVWVDIDTCDESYIHGWNACVEAILGETE